MGFRVRGLSAGITTMVLLGLPSPALADSPPPPPRSYKQVSPGNRFVFVMISPLPVEEEVKGWNEEAEARSRDVRRTYTRSGMYRNDGSTEPLWTVDWYAYTVDLVPDGVHLVRPGPWPGLRGDRTPDLDYEAVSFFANGQLIRTYRVGELVDDPGSLRKTASHFMWRKEGHVSGEFEYAIETLDGNRFVFDVRTGETVSESRAGRASRWGWWVAVGVVPAGLAVWLVWRRRSHPRREAGGPSVAVDLNHPQ